MLAPADIRPKDFAFVKSDGVYHLFYIRHNDLLPSWADENDFGHAVSTDLYHWTQLAPVMGLVPGSWDNLHVWAPHIVRQGDLWWMFYTGVTETPGAYVDTQRIGVAVSRDLMSWTRARDGPVWTTAGAPWAWWTTSQGGMACRDAFVMRDPAAPEQWLMFYTAAPATDTLSGVVGVARNPSGDLVTWQDEKPLWITYKTSSFSSVVESPHLLGHDGHWFLFITTNAGQPITFFVSSNPIGDVPEWTPKGRLRNMLGYDTSDWFASETLRDGNLDLFAFATLDRIELRRIVWGLNDTFALTEPSFFHMLSMRWTTAATQENQYVGLRLNAVNGTAFHEPLVAWTLSANGTESPIAMDDLGLPANPDLTHDSTLVAWYVRRPASLPAGEPMRVRVAMNDETASTGWLTVYPNPVTQPPRVWRGGHDPSPPDPGGGQPGGPTGGSGDTLATRPHDWTGGPQHDPQDPQGPINPAEPPAGAPAEPAGVPGAGPAANAGAPPAATDFDLRVLQATPLGAGPAIAFELGSPGRARVELFDVLGRKRLTLADGAFDAGVHVLPWDGRDATGARAGRGLYFVRVWTPERTAVARLVLDR